MSGFFGSLGIDSADVKANQGFKEPDDGLYEFEVSEAIAKHGTQNDPDAMGVIVKYLLDNGEFKSEYFAMPKDEDDENGNAVRGLANFKGRLIDLGFPDDADTLNSLELDDLVGITGAFRLVTKRSKNGKDYQNINNIRVEESDDDEPEEKPKAAQKKAPAKKAPAKKKAEPVEEEENPFAEDDE